MKNLAAFCMLLPAFMLASAQQPIVRPATTDAANQRQCPTQTGFYFSEQGQWKEMEQVRSLGVHTTGLAKTAFSYGMASAKVKATFPDAKAPVQIQGETPIFCSVNIAEQGRDIIAVKLETHGNKREIQLASIRQWSGISAQYKDKDMVKLIVEKQGERTFLMEGTGSIAEGEYIIFPRPQGPGKDSNFQKADGPTSVGGYDFGFRKDR